MEVARGEVNISLNEADVIAGLHRVDAEFDRAMAKIDREEAVAKIKADLGPLKRDLKDADARLKEWEATHKKALAGEDNLNARSTAQYLRQAKQRAQALRQQIAAQEAQLASQQRMNREQAVSERRAQTLARAERDRAKVLNDATRAQDLHSEALRKSSLEQARAEQRIAALRKQYAGLSDELEKLHAKRTPFGKEARVKVELDEAAVRTKMEAIKAELNFIGGHPPVEIKVDTEAGFANKLKYKFGRALADIGNKLSNVGNIRLNLGPFSGTLRTFTVAAATLGPILTSLLGSATALIGVLGTGLAGAASVAGGTIAGLVTNFIGVAAAVKPVLNDFKLAQQATQAYQEAVDKYGASSKQAKTAQDQMNSVLKSVDPNARKAALGAAKVSAEWRRLTQETARRDVGQVLVGGFKALDRLMPTLARNTNETMGILTKGITTFERKLSTGRGAEILGSLGRSANRFLGPAIQGAGHLASALGNIAEAAARIFSGKAGRGFEKWAADIEKATQPGARLDSEITRLGHHATDLLHFFSALGKLLLTVFNGGANAGDNLVQHMTAALNKWNGFLQSTRGRNDMAKFFQNAANNTRQLFNALAPLIAAFVTWTSNVTPLATAFLQGVSAISRIVSWVTRLIGLQGGLSTLAATFGAIWAVGKIGAFVSMLARAVTLMKELGAIGSLKTILTGGFGKALALREAETAGGSLAAGGVAGRVAKMLTGRGGSARAKAAGAGIGEDVATGLTAGIASTLGIAGAAIGGTGLLVWMLTKGGAHSTGQDEAIKATGKDLGSKTAQTYAKAYDDYIRSHQGKTFTGGRGQFSTSPVDTSALVAGARAAGQRAVAALQQTIQQGMIKGVSPAITGSINNAMRAVRANRNLNALQQTARGAQLVMNIQVTGDKQAQAALARLATTKLGTKFLTIIAKGGDKALRQLLVLAHTPLGNKILNIISQGGPRAQTLVQALDNAKIRAKLVSIIQHGGTEAAVLLKALDNKHISNKQFSTILHDLASGKLRQISGVRIANKLFSVTAKDNASGILSHVLGLLAGVHSVSATVTTTTRNVVQNIVSGVKHAAGRAEGGPISPEEKRAMGAVAAIDNAKRTFGGVHSKPTFLVGEENRPEVVISSNPAYKDKNISYWAMAGHWLGIPGFQMGGINLTRPHGLPSQLGGTPWRNPDEFKQPPLPKGYKPTKARRTWKLKKGKQAWSIGNQWSNYIDNLQTQEQNLDNDISVQESRVQEPDTLLKQIGTDGSGQPIYAIDDDAVKKYHDQLDVVRKMYLTLLEIIKKLYDAIPKAIAAFTAQKHAAVDDIGVIQDAISREGRKKKPDQAKMKDLRNRLSRANKVRTSAQADLNKVRGVRTTEQFNYANALTSYNEYAQDESAVMGKANTELQSNLGGAGGGTGGGSAGGVSGDAQAQIDQANQRATIALTGQHVAEAALATFTGPGDIGAGGTSAYAAAIGLTRGTSAMPAAIGGRAVQASAAGAVSGKLLKKLGGSAAAQAAGLFSAGGGGAGVSVVQYIQTLHPGDPTTLKAIGNAAAAGFSYQGARTGSRVRLGY